MVKKIILLFILLAAIAAIIVTLLVLNPIGMADEYEIYKAEFNPGARTTYKYDGEVHMPDVSKVYIRDTKTKKNSKELKNYQVDLSCYSKGKEYKYKNDSIVPGTYDLKISSPKDNIKSKVYRYFIRYDLNWDKDNITAKYDKSKEYITFTVKDVPMCDTFEVVVQDITKNDTIFLKKYNASDVGDTWSEKIKLGKANNHKIQVRAIARVNLCKKGSKPMDTAKSEIRHTFIHSGK